MDIFFNKKLLFLISIISIVLIWSFSSDNKPQIKKDENLAVKSEASRSHSYKKVSSDVKNIPPLIRKEYIKQKQKLEEEKVFHQNVLQTRKKYLENEQKKRELYLKHKIKYTQISSQQMKGKLDSLKREKEKVYQQRFKQSRIAQRSEEHSQGQQRVKSEKIRLKSLQEIQKKQHLNQKYKGE